MSIRAKIELDNSELKQGFKDAENVAKSSMRNIKGTAEGAGGMMSKLGKAAGAAADSMKSGFSGVTTVLSKMGPVGAAVAGAIALISTAVFGAFKAIDKLTKKFDGIAKAAKSVNMSANAYQALQYASSRAGVGMENVLSIISKIDYAMTHAAAGEKKYIDAFYALGLSWRELENMSPERQIMEVSDAWGKFLAQGRRIPSEMYDILGRKGVQQMNKLAQGDFSKHIAEANAMGLGLDEETVKFAEELTDTFTTFGTKLDAMASKLKLVKDGIKGVNAVTKELAELIGGEKGFVADEFKDISEGIGDVAQNMLNNERYRFSDEQKRRLLNASYRDKYNRLSIVPSVSQAKEMQLNETLSGEELDKKFAEMVKQTDLKQTGEVFDKVLHEVIAEIDKRFDADDSGTFVRAKKVDDATRLKNLRRDKVLDEALYLNNELKKTSEYYDRINNKLGKIVNIEEEINKIEAELKKATGDMNAELDASVKHALRMNAALANQKALQNELGKFKENGDKSFNAFYADMLGQMGASKQMVEQLFNASTVVTGNPSTRDNLTSSLNLQYYKEHLGRRQGESENDYLVRASKLAKTFEQIQSPEQFLRADPEGFFKAFKGIAEDVRKNNIFTVLSEDAKKEIKEAEAVYNEFAKKYKLVPIKIDLDVDTSDTAALASNANQVKAAITAITNYQDEWDAKIKELLDTKKLYEEELKKLNEEIGKVGTENFANTKQQKALEASIKSIDDRIKALNDQRDELEYVTKNLETKFNLPVLVEEFKKYNAENNLIEEITKKYSFRSSADDSRRELNTLTAQNKRQQGLVDLLEKQNILKKAGIAVTRENLELYKRELNAIIRVNKEIGAAKLQKDMLGKTQDNAINALKNAGLDRQAERLQMRISAEQTKGSPLNDYEKNLIDRLADVTSKINNWSMPAAKEDRIMTNELASKGGFSRSVAVDKRDNSAARLAALKELQKLFMENVDIQKEIKSALIN